MSDLLPLRPYQRECVDAVTASDLVRPAVVLPTGAGKTVVLSHLVKEYADSTGGRTLVLVHRDELARQTVDKLLRVAPHLTVGRVQAKDDDVAAPVVVASVQTASRAARLRKLVDAGEFGMVVHDECFPAGTLVGDVPIEMLRVGDLVPSYNEATGLRESRYVTQTMHKRPSALVRVTLGNGSFFVCTPNHPVMTAAGWRQAGELSNGVRVLSFAHDANADRSSVHGVRFSGNSDQQIEDRQLSEQRADVLLGCVPRHMGAPGIVRTDGQDQPEVRVGADAPEEPHALSGDAGQNGGNSPEYRAQAVRTRWEREAAAGGSGQAGVPAGVADGSYSSAGRRGASPALQSRHRSPGDEGVRRSGRGVALSSGPPKIGSAPGRTPGFLGVDHVEVLEPGSDGTYGGVCPNGLVYNIAVDTTHTYLINGGTVVHNCHHSISSSYVRIREAFPGARNIGFTATLARGDGVGLGSAWDGVAYRKTVLWMIARGYLADVRAVGVGMEMDLSGVKRSGGDYQDRALGEAMLEAEAPKFVARAVAEHARDRRMLVFTPLVSVAAAVARELAAVGIGCGTVTGTTPHPERQRIYEASRTGALQAIVNVGVLTEGADFPWIDCAVIARPTRSAPLFQQMAGRALRPYPGKQDALLLVLGGTGGTLATLEDLSEGEVLSVREGETLMEAAVSQEERSNAPVSAGSVRFVIKQRDLDVFAASSQNWLRTYAGVQFVPTPAGHVALWPAREFPGQWDVITVDLAGKSVYTEHRALPMGLAMAWAEEVADQMSDLNVRRGASWKRKPPSLPLVSRARRIGLNDQITPFMNMGQVSDLVAVHEASRAMDRHMRKVGG
jgi:superfamily II DNA or RNA helicase